MLLSICSILTKILLVYFYYTKVLLLYLQYTTCRRICHTAIYLLSFVVPFSLALFWDLLLQAPSALWCFPQPLQMPNSMPNSTH